MKYLRDYILAMFGFTTLNGIITPKESRIVPIDSRSPSNESRDQIGGMISMRGEMRGEKTLRSEIIEEAEGLVEVESEIFSVSDCYDENDQENGVRQYKNTFSTGYFTRDTPDPPPFSYSEVTKRMMMMSLFKENEFRTDFIHDMETLSNLYNMVILNVEDIKGPVPILPFSEESFVNYLFRDCRDLSVIKALLYFSRKNPTILGRMEQKLKKPKINTTTNNNSTPQGIRDKLMLPFFHRINRIDQSLAKTTLHLMGFSDVTKLRQYYEETGYVEEDFDWLNSLECTDIDYELT